MTNIVFTKIISLNGRKWEFNFRKLTGDEPHFYVDFTDARGERVPFAMHKETNGVWQSSGGKLPPWIKEGEQIIGNNIEEGLAELAADHP